MNKTHCPVATPFQRIGQKENVEFTRSLTITVKDYEATVKANDNSIILRTGVQCDYLKGHCQDVEYGYTYWDNASETACEKKIYDVLYDE